MKTNETLACLITPVSKSPKSTLSVSDDLNHDTARYYYYSIIGEGKTETGGELTGVVDRFCRIFIATCMLSCRS